MNTLALARGRIEAMEQRLGAAQLSFRRPPPEPTTCCGRGCNGCVWEGFYEALERWLAEAEALVKP